jgi:hypothetical protein
MSPFYSHIIRFYEDQFSCTIRLYFLSFLSLLNTTIEDGGNNGRPLGITLYAAKSSGGDTFYNFVKRGAIRVLFPKPLCNWNQERSLGRSGATVPGGRDQVEAKWISSIKKMTIRSINLKLLRQTKKIQQIIVIFFLNTLHLLRAAIVVPRSKHQNTSYATG